MKRKDPPGGDAGPAVKKGRLDLDAMLAAVDHANQLKRFSLFPNDVLNFFRLYLVSSSFLSSPSRSLPHLFCPGSRLRRI